MEWKQIDGYDYSVSSEGQVRNASGLIMKQSKQKNGYYRVNLWKNGKRKTHYVHRLVASAFIPFENGKDFVDHKDGEPTNNSVTNLRWATRQQNTQNASLSKRNTSGYKGVCFDKGRWKAYIRIDGKIIHLGYFDKPEEAAAVRSARANQEFGEFTHSCERV
jgi:hypothetical protein